MRLIINLVKWLLPMALTVIGLRLIEYGSIQEQKIPRDYQLYDSATTALRDGDFATAYSLFLQSASESRDPHLKAIAIYQAANIGWCDKRFDRRCESPIANYQEIVELYKQSLRFQPGFYEAGFNLEYLYWLKTNAPEQLPAPPSQPGPAGEEPGEGGRSNGDI